MKILISIFYFSILTTSLSADIMIDQLINKTHKIGWYMFQVKKNNITRSYLANNRDSTKPNGIKIWNFTNKKKWRPIHNAQAFDGFIGAAYNFKTISIGDTGKSITFGQKTINKNIPLDSFLNDLKNATFDIRWYYWKTSSGYPFLAYNRDSTAGLSIYQHTASGKWKPIHNALSFDGYPTAKSVFNSVKISSDGREIIINYFKFNIPLIKNVLPRETVIDSFLLTSNDFNDEIYKNGTAITLSRSPHLDWTNVPARTQSLGLEIINITDNKAVWRVMNIQPGDSNSSFMPPDAVINYKGMTTFENDYDFEKKFYTDPNTGLIPKGDYLVVLYALSIKTASLLTQWQDAILQHTNMLFKIN